MEGNLILLYDLERGRSRAELRAPILDHELSVGVERLEAKDVPAVQGPDPYRDRASRLKWS